MGVSIKKRGLPIKEPKAALSVEYLQRQSPRVEDIPVKPPKKPQGEKRI